MLDLDLLLLLVVERRLLPDFVFTFFLFPDLGIRNLAFGFARAFFFIFGNLVLGTFGHGE